MTRVSLIGDPCEATGHPPQCTEPAPGTVEGVGSILSVNGTSVYSADSADMVFGSHAHSYSTDKGCFDVQSHSLDPDQSHILSVNGTTVQAVGDSTTDPGSGGTASITSTSNDIISLP
jgi:hypothetical protein